MHPAPLPALTDLGATPPHWLNLAAQARILDVVTRTAVAFHVIPAAIFTKCKTERLCMARHAAMTLLRDRFNFTLQEIAATFGRKDHGTVSNALRQTSNRWHRDLKFRAIFDQLSQA